MIDQCIRTFIILTQDQYAFRQWSINNFALFIKFEAILFYTSMKTLIIQKGLDSLGLGLLISGITAYNLKAIIALKKVFFAVMSQVYLL